MGRPNPQRAGRLSLKLWALMLDRPASCATLVISSRPALSDSAAIADGPYRPTREGRRR